jgi:hypothetical protein
MSKGPGRVMRAVCDTIDARPECRFAIVELAEFVYPDAPVIERKHLVAVRAAVKKLDLETRKRGAGNFRQGWRLEIASKGQGSRQFKANFGCESEALNLASMQVPSKERS